MRREATHAVARMRLGDLDVGAALETTLRSARENDERAQWARCLEALAELALRRGEPEACSIVAGEMLALAEGAGAKDLAARAHRWRGEAFVTLGDRDAGTDALALSAAAAAEIGRVCVEKDATEALAKIGGDAARRARAAALAARFKDSARECQRLMAAD